MPFIGILNQSSLAANQRLSCSDSGQSEKRAGCVMLLELKTVTVGTDVSVSVYLLMETQGHIHMPQHTHTKAK